METPILAWAPELGGPAEAKVLETLRGVNNNAQVVGYPEGWNRGWYPMPDQIAKSYLEPEISGTAVGAAQKTATGQLPLSRDFSLWNIRGSTAFVFHVFGV